MRPRVFPAEDPFSVKLVAHAVFASMRPRVFPAEDTVMHTEKPYLKRLQ